MYVECEVSSMDTADEAQAPTCFTCCILPMAKTHRKLETSWQA